MTLQEKLELYSRQIQCGGNIWFWHYDYNLVLQNSNCPTSTILDELLDYYGCKTMIKAHMEQSLQPMMLGVSFGLTWGAAFAENEDGTKDAYVIGPVFSATAATAADLASAMSLARHDHALSPAWIREMQEVIKTLPIMQITLLAQDILMLHFMVTDQFVATSDIFFQSTENDPVLQHREQQERRRVWNTEKALLQMVREGNMGYKEAINKASLISSGVPLQSTDELRQAKTSVIVFIALCTRAAIEGGLSPEQSYSLGDMYIQSVESGKTISEVAACSYNMYADFVERVHRVLCGPEYSSEIRSVCEYVDQHPGEDLSAGTIAKHIGYAEYYLTKKFKAETGISLTDYVKKVRIEKAKLLLSEGEMTVQEVAHHLHFCSRSYFSTIFTQAVGMTPAQYRLQNKRL